MSEIKTFHFSNKHRSPKIIWGSENNIMIGIKDWGFEPTATSIRDDILDFIRSKEIDFEITNPFERLACYTDLQNHIRQSLLLANDKLYTGSNFKTLKAGLEIFCLSVKGNECSWAFAGDFFVFKKKSFNETSIIELIQGPQMHEPLAIPLVLLGVEHDVHLHIGGTALSSGMLEHEIYIVSGGMNFSDSLLKCTDIHSFVKLQAKQLKEGQSLQISQLIIHSNSSI